MRQGVALVFDEVILGPTDAYTAPELNALLAVQDQMGFQVIVDNVRFSVAGGPPTLSVWLETSGDGRNWATKNTGPEVQPFSIFETQTNVSPYSADVGTLPTLRFARLRITMATAVVGQTMTAHIKIFVTFRDLGGEIITGPAAPDPVAEALAAATAIGNKYRRFL
jgi:hypothetical protein